MLRLLKSNNPVNYVLVLFFMIALWGYRFAVMPTAVDTGGMQSYFFRFLYEASVFQYIYAMFAFVLAFGFACYVAKSNFKYQIVESGYQLPALFFALLTGSIINAQRCIPEMVSTLFLSMSVLKMFGMYNKYEDVRSSLDVGLLYGLSLIFAYKYIVFLPAMIILMMVVKSVTWRDVLSFFISMTFVLGAAFCLTWLYGDWHELVASVKDEAVRFVIGEKYNVAKYTFSLPVIFSVVISILSMFTLKVFRKTAEMKFYHSMLFLMAYFGIYMLSPISSNESIWLMYFPLCYLLTNVVVNARRLVIQRIVFYGLLVSLILSQLLQIVYFNSIF